MTPIASLSTHMTIRGRSTAPSVWLRRAEFALLMGFLLFTFVGTRPFDSASVAERAEGNMLDRLVVMGLFALSLAILWVHRHRAARLFLANLPTFLLVGFALSSYLWSDYPPLTFRRSLLLFFLTVIAFATAVSTRSLRQLHMTLFVTMTLIILVNLLGCVLWPDIAISDIGVRGMYSQKNVAGIVALVTMILGATWVLATREKLHFIYGLLALLPTAFFLVITLSKTSINLTALGLLVIFFFAMIEKHGRPFILFSLALGLIVLLGLTMWLATLEFNIQEAMTLVIGDTSFSGRDELWAFTRRDAERRFWLGHGYGAYWDVGKLNDPLVRAEAGTWLASVEIGIINQAHHGYLELWLHLGQPATVLATAIVVFGALYGAFFALFGNGSVETRAALGALTMLLILYMLHNFTEATLFMRGASFNSTATLALFLVSRAAGFTLRDQNGREA
jgi:O-antigen ligase